VGDDDADTLAERLRTHFGHREHLYGVLLADMADDWEAAGVTREVFAGWEDVELRQFPSLRLLAGLFRIVLRGDAPQLEGFYPALGGDRDPAGAWPSVRSVVAANVAELRDSLRLAPQTNEPGRTLALQVGIADAVRRTGIRRIRLLEVGASGGLGLLVDRYRFTGDGWSCGPAASPMRVAGCGLPGFVPEPVEIIERRGCDVAPVDASTAQGGTYLRSFVWPWMVERHARLGAALDLARRHPVRIDRAGASTWLTERLAEPAGADVLTVVWHSVTRLYWPDQESAAVTAAIDAARHRMPLAHIAFEHRRRAGSALGPPVVEVDGRAVAVGDDHGPPARWIR
jgi:hypothetical protein